MTFIDSKLPLLIGLPIIVFVAIAVVGNSYSSISESLPEETTTTTITVPAVTPDDPTLISGLVAWYDADDSDTITIETGVSQWNDKSGNGNHLVQSDTTQQPTVVAGDSNGHDVILFDGNNDNMIKAFTGGAEGQPNTIIIYLKPDPDLVSSHYIFDGVISTEISSLFQQASTGFYGWDSGSILVSTGVRSTDYELVRAEYNNPTSKLYRNNGTLMGSGASGIHDMSGLTIGSRYDDLFYGNIRVGDIMAYNKLLNSTEVDMINDYIEYKYDIGMPLVGEYSNETTTQGTTTVESSWNEQADRLQSSAQIATGLFIVMILTVAAVILLFVLKTI